MHDPRHRSRTRAPKPPNGAPNNRRRESGRAASAAHRAESPGRPRSEAATVVALELVVNRHDLASKVGHLCVACHLVMGEPRHLVGVVMRDAGALSRSREAVRARGAFAPLEQQMQPAPQPHQPLSQIGRDAHERMLPPRARPAGRVRTPTGRIGRCAGESSLTSRRVLGPVPTFPRSPEFQRPV
jgi:hypothetical protein